MVLAVLSPIGAVRAHETVDSNINWAAGGIGLEYDNDLLINSDDKFTNGFFVQWHSRVSVSWDGIRVPGWMKFGQRLPGMNSSLLYNRVGLAIGQYMQTPGDLSATDLIVDDVPYAGSLGFEINWTAYNDEVFRGYALIVGVIGPSSGAESVQKAIHKLIGADSPMGWDNQIPDEPAVNFDGMFKKKLIGAEGREHLSANVAFNADFRLGTALTFGEVAVEVRRAVDACRLLPPNVQILPA